MARSSVSEWFCECPLTSLRYAQGERFKSKDVGHRCAPPNLLATISSPVDPEVGVSAAMPNIPTTPGSPLGWDERSDLLFVFNEQNATGHAAGEVVGDGGGLRSDQFDR